MRTRQSNEPLPVEEVQPAPVSEQKANFLRPNSHSHISKLSEADLHGLSLQRGSLLTFAEMIRAGESSFVILYGPPSSGKSALLHSLELELSSALPVLHLDATDFVPKHESLKALVTKHLRACVSVSLEEDADVVMGEVVSLTYGQQAAPRRSKAKQADALEPLRGHGKLVMKTGEMTSSYQLGMNICLKMEEIAVQAGDVIKIDRTNGKVTRVGRRHAFGKENTVYNAFQNFVSIPSGELQNRAKKETSVTLSEMDSLNSRPDGFLGVFCSTMLNSSVTGCTRKSVDAQVVEWVHQEKCSVRKGLLVIENAEKLGLAFYALLEQMDNVFCPSVVMKTSTKVTVVNGKQMMFGAPVEFLNRCLVLRTENYKEESLKKIVEGVAGQELSEKFFEFVKRRGLRESMSVVRIWKKLGKSSELIKIARKLGKIK